MKRLNVLFRLIVLVGMLSKVFPSPHNGIPIQFTQPDGSTFIGITLGDEFISRSETADGYTFILSSTSGWYQYADQDKKGVLITTSLVVGLDDPAAHGIDKHLDHPEQAYIDAVIQFDIFNQSPPPGGGCSGTGWSGELSLGIILIQFPADSGFDAIGGDTNYTITHFEEMAFSQAGYNESPNQEQAYGSMYDYFQEVSYGQATLTGGVINPEDPANTDHPIWYTAEHHRQYYINLGIDNDALIEEAFDEAGIDPDTGSYDKYAIIYAGSERLGGLHPRAEAIGGCWYIVSEKYNSNFRHIGVHCHELSHLVGLLDRYAGHPMLPSIGDWGLMGNGSGGPHTLDSGLGVNSGLI